MTFTNAQFANAERDSLQLVESVAKNINPDDPILQTWYSNYSSNQKFRLAVDLDIVKEYLKPSQKILEFGSVPPILTASLARLDYDIQGIDIAPERFSSAIKDFNLKITQCDIENQKIPFEDDYFEAIIFNEIFEHLRNLLFAMREVHRITKPGGLLLLSTPNLRSLEGILNFLFKNKAYSCCENIYSQYLKLETLGHMGHIREYTSREVVEFLQQVGFDCKAILFRGGNNYRGKLKKTIAKFFPSLCPFMTIIAQKFQ